MTRYVLVDRESGIPDEYFVRTNRQGPFTVRVWSRQKKNAKRLTASQAMNLTLTRPFRHCTVESAE